MTLTPDWRNLPDPVRRYLALALGEERRPTLRTRMTQTGILRTDLRGTRWMKFTAAQEVLPEARRFRWDARVRILPLLQLDVRDAYAEGVGSGQVRLPPGVTIAADRDRPELNAAALHRFLAEAVWYPTALLPSDTLHWTAMDADCALATLTDGGNKVSLEFRFDQDGTVGGVYTAGRWARIGKRYVLKPWEGHFSDYRRRQGLLVPSRGEVGWHEDGRLEVVWKGELTSVEYEFARG